MLMSMLDIALKSLYYSVHSRYNIYAALREEVSYPLFKRIVELILAPLIVGILVSLFNYWLNH